MLVALASLKGSAGATSFGVALTAAWPGDVQRVFVECDPAGGDIASRYSLPLSPGLIGLAAATRQGSDLDVLWRHTQCLPDGTPIVVGPLRGDQARTALTALVGSRSDTPSDATQSSLFTASAQARDSIVVADCGRLDPDTAALPIVKAANALLLLLRPRADELSHLAAQLDDIAALADRIGLVLVGTGYSATEVAAELEVPIFATVPELAPRSGSSRFSQARARTRLHRAAATIAEQLALIDQESQTERAASVPASLESDLAEPDEHGYDETGSFAELTANSFDHD
jgi:hypothetical protein